MKKEECLVAAIDRFQSKGWGIGLSGQEKIEVIGGVPGDLLKVLAGRKRRGKRRGDLLEVVQPSPDRVPLRCTHAPQCGGCTWQQVEYAAQLREKMRRLREVYAPLLVEQPDLLKPIIPCENPWQYRNKMEFSFSQNRAGEKFLGLILAGSRGHVFHLTECSLVSNWFASVLASVRSWWEGSDLGAYRMNDTGSLRTLTVREGKRTGDKLVMLTVSGNPDYALKKEHLASFVAAVKSSLGQECWDRLSIFLRIHQLQKGSPTQFFEVHLSGPDHLKEELHLPLDQPAVLRFKISPTSFFQPNTFQAEKLYTTALQCTEFPKKHVLDLYAGTATLGMAMATRAEKVTAIEINPYACFDAEANKEFNGISNLEILCGDVGKKLLELQTRPDFVPPELVVVDPPRTGLDATAISHLAQLKAPELLYISCNPATQAANLAELSAKGYQIALLQPVDQFPHTPHVEMVAKCLFS